MTDPRDDQDPEIAAISEVYSALKGLDAKAQERVLKYVSGKLQLQVNPSTEEPGRFTSESGEQPVEPRKGELPGEQTVEGISPVARKWMTRNQLEEERISQLFSLGVDEIDLVAGKVPGGSKKDRMLSVILLKGVASYLGSGQAKIGHKQIKEACMHYDAYDGTNFSKYLKGMAAEIGGSKESGYTLTARGLTKATTLVKELSASK